MIYKKVTEQLIHDDELFDTAETLNAMSKRTGISTNILSDIRNEKRIVREETYKKYRAKILDVNQ